MEAALRISIKDYSRGKKSQAADVGRRLKAVNIDLAWIVIASVGWLY